MLSKPTWLLGKTEACCDDIVFAVAMTAKLEFEQGRASQGFRVSSDVGRGFAKLEQSTVSGTRSLEKGVNVDTR